MKDFPGLPFASLPEPTAPDFTFRLRNMLSVVDFWARDASGGFARINKGEVPDGSGVSLSGVTDHGALTGLADDDHLQYLLLAGRGTQTVTDPISLTPTYVASYGANKPILNINGSGAFAPAIRIRTLNATGGTSSGLWMTADDSTSVDAILVENGSSQARFNVSALGTTGIGAADDPNISLRIIGLTSTGPHLSIKDSAFGGTPDLTRWLSSAGATLARISVSGEFDGPITTQKIVSINGPGGLVQSPVMTCDQSGVFSGTGPALTDGIFFGEFQLPGTGLSASRFYIFPDGSGTVVLSGVTSTLAAGLSSTLLVNTAGSGTAFIDSTTNTKKLRMVLSGTAASTNNSFTLTNTAARNFGFGNLSGNVVVVGDDPPAVASGNLGKVDLTAQVANITTTNLSSTPPAGLYAVEVYLACTTADVTAGTLTVTIGWTDAVGATTSTPIAAFSLAATGRVQGRQLVQVASGDITYAVAVTGAYGTSQYAVYVRVLSLG